jgi:hypothetical protein
MRIRRRKGRPVTLPAMISETVPTKKAPTLILNNGSDGSFTFLWPGLGQPGLERGYNVVVFDGPGQSMLFKAVDRSKLRRPPGLFRRGLSGIGLGEGMPDGH